MRDNDPQPEAAVDHKRVGGLTSLMIAAKEDRIDMVKCLAEQGANVDEKIRGTTALMIAKQIGNQEMVRYLKERGATEDNTSFCALQ